MGSRVDHREQALFPGEPLQLPDAEARRAPRRRSASARRRNHQAERTGVLRSAGVSLVPPHSASRPCSALLRYCKATENALERPQHAERDEQHERQEDDEEDPEGRLVDDFRPQRRAPSRRSQRSGSRRPQVHRPHPAKPRSRPQTSQVGATVMKPLNMWPMPQRGQRPRHAGAIGRLRRIEIVVRHGPCPRMTDKTHASRPLRSLMKKGAARGRPLSVSGGSVAGRRSLRRCRPRHRWRRRGTATPRRRNASTRRRNSKPRCCLGVKCPAIVRSRQTSRNTCR